MERRFEENRVAERRVNILAWNQEERRNTERRAVDRRHDDDRRSPSETDVA